MTFSRILGTGGYLPERVMTNADLEKLVETNDEWIVQRTGIRSRHIAADHESASTMAEAAARPALASASLDPKDIDMIIVATSTPENVFPGTSCLVQKRLGIGGCAAFDLNTTACAGFIYALSIADQFIRTGMIRHALVIGSEVMSRILDWTDRSTCILFGDGAGAVVLGAASEPGILSTHLHADGNYGDVLCLPTSMGRIPHEDTSIPRVQMNGNSLFRLSVNILGDLFDETLGARNLEQASVDWLIPHQANIRIIQGMAKKLKLPMERVALTLETQGNTSGASIPLALDTAIRDGRIKRGETLLLEGFGAGLAWGIGADSLLGVISVQPYAVIFPGQGSQSVGMLADMAATFPVIRTTFAEASAALGYDLWELVQQGPAEKLDRTVYTQPALLTASCALWRVVCQEGPSMMPVAMAGHSLGEYSALVSAGALAFDDAVRLVAARGRYMQEAVPMGEGALAVLVGLDEAAVAVICQQAAESEVLSPANFNSPGQIVIAGQLAAVERAMVLAKEAGAKMARHLPVSVPSHCALMRPAAERLEKALAPIELHATAIPVISNVDVARYDSPEAIRAGLVRQLYSPVRWVESIQACHALGATRFFECGPGKVLTGLGKRIVTEAEWLPATDLARLTERGQA